MKYKILDVAPGQIKVEYEDKSWAIVPIAPGATLEDIDNEVSKYDPEFLKKQEEVCNPDVYIGMERVSFRKENQDPIPSEIKPSSTPDSIFKSIVIPSMTYNHPFSLDIIARYLSKKGDTSLQDTLDSFVEDYFKQTNITTEQLISEANEIHSLKFNRSYMMTDDELMAQAEAELEAENK